MKVYKFKDIRDGNYAFVFAKDLESAKQKIKSVTELKLQYVETKDSIDSWIIFNKIKEK